MESDKMCWCDGFVAGWVCLKPVGCLFEACWLPHASLLAMGRSLLAVNKALWLLKACWLLADICSGLWTACLLLMAMAKAFERLKAVG